MKLLRNPVVVGLLAVVALGVVLYQVMGAKLFRGRPSAPKPSVAAALPAAPNRAASAPNPGTKAAGSGTSQKQPSFATVPLPRQGVDASAIEDGFKTWVAAPRRDPFWLLAPIVEKPGSFESETNSPVATWTLNAIMNQTDSRLAVIMDQVYRVGDVIQGYKLVRIEQDEVWFQGPTRHERLGFAKATQGTLTNNAPKQKGK